MRNEFHIKVQVQIVQCVDEKCDNMIYSDECKVIVGSQSNAEFLTVYIKKYVHIFKYFILKTLT